MNDNFGFISLEEMATAIRRTFSDALVTLSEISQSFAELEAYHQATHGMGWMEFYSMADYLTGFDEFEE